MLRHRMLPINPARYDSGREISLLLRERGAQRAASALLPSAGLKGGREGLSKKDGEKKFRREQVYFYGSKLKRKNPELQNGTGER